MKRGKKTLIFFLSLIFIISPLVSFADDSERQAGDNIVGVDENVRAYIIGNEENGDIFYQKDAETKYPIASMSKLMTFLLVRDQIDQGKLSLDTKIKGTKEAEELTGPGYSKLGIKEGEEYTVKELITGLIVVSGNDCANLLATSISGSEDKFAQNMNEKAKELGLTSQEFYNASGLNTEDNKQNSSSAKDLFELVRIILDKYPDILEYSKIREINDSKRGINEKSTIPLIGEIDGVDGLKTGTTEEAKSCLTTTIDMSKLNNKNNYRAIGIVMGASDKEVRDMAMTDLIYYVSRVFNFKKIADTNHPLKSVRVNSVKEGYVELYPSEDLSFIVKDNTMPSVKYDINKNIKAPIKKGEVFGKANISYNDKNYEIDLVSNKEQERASDFTRFKRTISDACDFLVKCIIAR
ncbi:D-alanyl-D-alanine carboxypeptidase [Anaerococcus sp. AGMB00486]|uniref:serine-type D-Ala-D-Ala carboxypeptidase n=2 Tax=Anaerococcus TaxID=165779 RepID=A0ABX2N9J8_9FIRM|nr:MULTISPECIES: D-alanyl-D-alanine carboxypeptidase family protein [Anaerococcus]MDY3006141.1 D-alanyl-D-alanine carboxypeptidase family protein [Anaerococcus porci]MSS78493.1 D-alanyl-D-alanine carboxypeptidase [Anaerococcus porci]NVF11349.1 D-alanyl-D-alanine carboxypeptidase [Anaerococcus faecalis]